jgi:hypothetical protein
VHGPSSFGSAVGKAALERLKEGDQARFLQAYVAGTEASAWNNGERLDEGQRFGSDILVVRSKPMNSSARLIVFFFICQAWIASTLLAQELVATASISTAIAGDGLEFQDRSGDEVTLFPANGNYATFTVTLKYSNGSPAPGKQVSCMSKPLSLTGAEWRNVDNLAPRFKGGETTIRQRIMEGTVRLSVKVTPSNGLTDVNGQISFRLDSFHLGGNDANPAADEIIATSEAGLERLIEQREANRRRQRPCVHRRRKHSAGLQRGTCWTSSALASLDRAVPCQ